MFLRQRRVSWLRDFRRLRMTLPKLHVPGSGLWREQVPQSEESYTGPIHWLGETVAERNASPASTVMGKQIVSPKMLFTVLSVSPVRKERVQ